MWWAAQKGWLFVGTIQDTNTRLVLVGENDLQKKRTYSHFNYILNIEMLRVLQKGLIQVMHNAGLLSRSQTRYISSKQKQKQQRWGQRLQQESKMKSGEGLPLFMPLMRQIYKKVHPDLLRNSHPELARVNDTSMQVLNGVLSTIKEFGEYPPQIIKNIPFHMLDGNGATQLVSLRIMTAGGECKRQLTECFGVFFRETGVLSSAHDTFRWDKEYFPATGVAEGDDGDDDADEVVIRV